MPGCGKTVLSSTIIANMLEPHDNDHQKIVAYFYFRFDDNLKTDPVIMLRSIIWQLIQQSVKIQPCVDALFSSSVYKIERRELLKEDALRLLQQILQDSPKVFLIVDALDECTQTEKLFSILETIAGWQLENVKLLMTSRDELRIRRSLEQFVGVQNRICVKEDQVDKDISKYVQHELANSNKLRKWHRSPEIIEEIRATLAEGAKGMY